ncbi:hypothetical protein [Corynebacterium auris]|uniref:hypothetical protein n=1 Tax=Corynebacterium auris TaxID=44750 RepID=UPI0025B5A9EE|nr:hypothetical protein [Corynebacterium auris]
MAKLYLVASVLMGIGGILVLPSQNLLASAAMLVAAGLAADHYRHVKRSQLEPGDSSQL